MNTLSKYLRLLPLCWVMSYSYAQAEERSMLVLDASGSMWGKIDDKTKIVIARDALKSLIADWPADRQVGLVVYGHRSKGECNDIETILPVGKLDVQQMGKIVDGISPKGKTPLSAAVKQAAEALKYTEDKATVILLSDGKETCDMDPCALGTELETLGVDFTAHVIGFDVNTAEDQAGLKCLAENTGGKFIPAANAKELNAALQQTAQLQAAEPAPEPPKPKPEPKPEASLIVPDSATKGTVLKVELKASAGLAGHVYLYAKGKDKHITYGYAYADEQGGYKPSEVRLPITPGEYVLKWQKDDEVYAEAPLQVTDSKVSLEMPASALKGSLLKVGLKGIEGLDGHVYLYAKDKDKHITYGYVYADQQGGYKPSELRLPTTPGDYTVKWQTGRDEVLAEAPLQVVDSQISLEMPKTALKGSLLKIGLNAPDGLDGHVYLYAKGKDNYISYGYAYEDSIKGYKPAEIRLPTQLGDYEVKWLSSREELLAAADLTITDAEVTISAPEQVEPETNIEIALNGPDGLDGHVYLFAEGKDKYISYGYARADSIKGYEPAKLTMPKELGKYQLKWLTSREDFLAETSIEVVNEIKETDQPTADQPTAKPSDASTTNSSTAEAKTAPASSATNINKVPPDGVESLDEKSLTYYKELGPLQFAAYQVPLPDYPAWRLYLALYPTLDTDGVLSGYRVEAQRINVSPLVYEQVVKAYGKKIADAKLNNTAASDQFTLPFMIVQSVTAEPILEQVKQGASTIGKQACGLQAQCDQLWVDSEAEWSAEKPISLERVPWDKALNQPAALIRALAQQTHWLQKQGDVWQWVTPELPEGIDDQHPWVEVVIDNYTGNGGMVSADWIERVADDSVAQQVTRVMLEDGTESGKVYQAQRCVRGDTSKLLKVCP